MKNSIIYYILLILLISSCKKTDDLKLKIIDLRAFNNINTVLLDTSLSKRFTEQKAVSLENTTQFSEKEVRKIIRIDNYLYIQIKNELRIYNCSTGKCDKSFYKGTPYCSISAFEFDNTNNQLFVVSSKNPMLYCYDKTGNIKFKIPLRLGYEYDDLIRINDNNLLLTTRTIPYPVTFIINTITWDVKAIDSTTKKIFTPNDKIFREIILNKSPLYIHSRSNRELLIKYIFNDTVFAYTSHGKIPKYYLYKGRDGLKYANKKKIFAKNNQLSLTGLWNLKGKYLIRFGNKNLIDIWYVIQ